MTDKTPQALYETAKEFIEWADGPGSDGKRHTSYYMAREVVRLHDALAAYERELTSATHGILAEMKLPITNTDDVIIRLRSILLDDPHVPPIDTAPGKR